jgi:hypothetical protein
MNELPTSHLKVKTSGTLLHVVIGPESDNTIALHEKKKTSASRKFKVSLWGVQRAKTLTYDAQIMPSIAEV